MGFYPVYDEPNILNTMNLVGQDDDLYNEMDDKKLGGHPLFDSYKNSGSSSKLKNRSTEERLNADYWVTGDGEKAYPREMTKDHIRNTLNFLYRISDTLWLNCEDTKVIDLYENGEDFFQRVVRYSTLWESLTKALQEEKQVGFNFEHE